MRFALKTFPSFLPLSDCCLVLELIFGFGIDKMGLIYFPILQLFILGFSSCLHFCGLDLMNDLCTIFFYRLRDLQWYVIIGIEFVSNISDLALATSDREKPEKFT